MCRTSTCSPSMRISLPASSRSIDSTLIRTNTPTRSRPPPSMLFLRSSLESRPGLISAARHRAPLSRLQLCDQTNINDSVPTVCFEDDHGLSFRVNGSGVFPSDLNEFAIGQAHGKTPEGFVGDRFLNHLSSHILESTNSVQFWQPPAFEMGDA